MVIYGLKNCDATRKLIKEMKSRGASFSFVDVQEMGLDRQKVEQWIQIKGINILLNRKSTTWRNLAAAEKESLTDSASAVDLIVKHVKLLKRPILEWNKTVFVGNEALKEILSSF